MVMHAQTFVANSNSKSKQRNENIMLAMSCGKEPWFCNSKGTLLEVQNEMASASKFQCPVSNLANKFLAGQPFILFFLQLSNTYLSFL